MPAAPSNPQPWPMKWIVVAILALVVPYTLLTLQYRKPGRAFEPYEDTKNRVNVSRLLAAGYRRVPIPAQRPAGGMATPGGAVITSAPGGLPDALRATLVEVPELAADILGVVAAPSTTTLQSYVIELTCTLPTDEQQVRDAELYLLGAEGVILPRFERVANNRMARSRDTAAWLTVPPGAFKAGQYTLRVVGERTSLSWPLEVK